MLIRNEFKTQKFQPRGFMKVEAQNMNKALVALFMLFLFMTQGLRAEDINLPINRSIDFFCSFTLCPQTQVQVRVDSNIVHYGYAHCSVRATPAQKGLEFKSTNLLKVPVLVSSVFFSSPEFVV